VLSRLNLKRFALSLGVVGAIATPILTGSFKDAVNRSWGITLEDDEYRYLVAHGMNPYTCSIDQYFNQYGGNERKICGEIRGLVGQNVVQKSFFNWTPLKRVLTDLLLGFFAPFVFVLFVPRVAKAYFGWVTQSSK